MLNESEQGATILKGLKHHLGDIKGFHTNKFATGSLCLWKGLKDMFGASDR